MTDKTDSKDDSQERLKDSLDQLINPLQTQMTQLQMWLQCRNLGMCATFALLSIYIVLTCFFSFYLILLITDVNDQNIDDLREIDKTLTNLEQSVSKMNTMVEKELESMVYVERLDEALKLNDQRINYLSQNCDKIKLPKLTNMQHLQPSQALQTIINNDKNNNNNNNNTNSRRNIFNNDLFIQSNDTMFNENINIINIGHNNNNSNNNKSKNKNNRNIKNSQATATTDGQVIKKRRLNNRSSKHNNNNNYNYNYSNSNSNNSSHVLSPQGHRNGNGNGGGLMVSQVRLVGKDEFDNVPQYVRSRLTQERVNNAIEDFNSELRKKYKVLRANPSKLSSHQFELYDVCCCCM